MNGHTIINTWRADETNVDLVEILKLVPQNDWTWTLFHWDGQMIECSPEDLSDGPKSFTWNELNEFAKKIRQTYEITIVASDGPPNVTVEQAMDWQFKAAPVNLGVLKMVIVEIDCSHWRIDTAEPVMLQYPLGA